MRFLCVCSVFSSISVQLHWSYWPPSQNGSTPRWFYTSKGLLGCGPVGIMAGDAIITDSVTMHVAGVPIVNLSTIIVWEVTPGPGNGFQTNPKTCITSGVLPLIPPNWVGSAPLAAYLFSWQHYLLSQPKQGNEVTDKNIRDAVPLFCSAVSNFSAYVSPEAAAKSAATTTPGSGVTEVAIHSTRAGSVIALAIVEGPPNLGRDARCWQHEHERWQDIAVATKWLLGVSPEKILSIA
ncbi:mediator of RNA polymerase II transcription subunit 16-like [Trifolium pratense]|uniref:mediator of RNA polymerase II transcription subunit 16-like n=1 Tax=Trifolium pratense TaxID=57577 RepID=UPI001E697AF7|nr:mediator of RNA polymerase II transcription subunit 16-like [Trifolium pratense]